MAQRINPRPFLKWAGGKSQLLPKLRVLAPKEFGIYHEPFVGGGALFFEMQRNEKVQNARLSDFNRELIGTYEAIRDEVDSVIARLQTFPHNARFFYELRRKKPRTPVTCAARMIYLNKTCYNGLYRVNRRGQFNAPFGRYKNPTICDEKNLRATAKALKAVDLSSCGFECVLERARKDDFVYFAPPYDPVSRTANFTSYQAGGFNRADQERLRDVFAELAGRGVKVMLSNSTTPFIQELYSEWRIREVSARRAINSNAAKRKGHKELIVTSY